MQNLCNVLCRVAASEIAVAKIETHRNLPAGRCSWLHWATKLATELTRSNPVPAQEINPI